MLFPHAHGVNLSCTNSSHAISNLIDEHSFKLRILTIFSLEILSTLLFIKITEPIGEMARKKSTFDF